MFRGMCGASCGKLSAQVEASTLSEFLTVAESVLRKHGLPLTPKQIVDYAFEHGLFTDRISGKTPVQTMKSKLSVDVRRNAERSRFVRTRPGTFFVRDAVPPGQVYSAPRYERAPDRSDVRVIAPAKLDELGRFQGIKRGWRRYAKLLNSGGDVSFQARSDAEASESWKQILTYILVTGGDRVLCFKRGNFSRVEDYLRGSLCIGFGGHVTRDDFDLLTQGVSAIHRSAARELAEELRLPKVDLRRLADGKGLKIVGILNDDSSVVGRKHIAFLLRYEVSKAKEWARPARGEKSVAQLHWIERDPLPQPIWRFEYWSQLCLRTFFPELAQSLSAYRLVRPARLRDAGVLFVMGTVGSGKTEAAKLIAKYTKRNYINSGALVAELIGIDAVTPATRSEFQREAQKFISSVGGPASLGKAIAERIASAKGRAVVDGIRQRATYEAVRTKLGARYRTASIFVHTTPDMAHNFYSARKGQAISFLDFLAVRDAPVETEVPQFLRDADAVVYNWEGRRQYERTVRALVKRITSNVK